jgi:hypothetical protein
VRTRSRHRRELATGVRPDLVIHHHPIAVGEENARGTILKNDR